MGDPEHSSSDAPSGSNDVELDYLDFLNFPDDIDWSSALILKCDPEGAPYKLIDVSNGLHDAVHRNDVHNLGPTVLNYVFTLTFKTDRAAEFFLRNHRDGRSRLLVKDRPCLIRRVPTRYITMVIRWIPVDVDTAHIVEVLKQYGEVVKTFLIHNDKHGWFHVYTGERKFHVILHDGVDVNDLPYSLIIKGLYAAVFVSERNPKCLDCFYSGHRSDNCKYRGCLLYRE